MWISLNISDISSNVHERVRDFVVSLFSEDLKESCERLGKVR